MKLKELQTKMFKNMVRKSPSNAEAKQLKVDQAEKMSARASNLSPSYYSPPTEKEKAISDIG